MRQSSVMCGTGHPKAILQHRCILHRVLRCHSPTSWHSPNALLCSMMPANWLENPHCTKLTRLDLASERQRVRERERQREGKYKRRRKQTRRGRGRAIEREGPPPTHPPAGRQAAGTHRRTNKADTNRHTNKRMCTKTRTSSYDSNPESFGSC